MACSIDLGIVEGVGVIAESEDIYEKHLDARILRGIDPDFLQKLLRVSILQQQQQQQHKKIQYQGSQRHPAAAQMITGLVFPQPTSSTLDRNPRFAALFPAEGVATDSAQSSGTGDDGVGLQALRALLRLGTTAMEQAQLAAVVEVLNQQLGRMLGSTSAMEPDRPLGGTYGVDSLAALEVRNWVRRGLGELLGAGSITTLDIMGAETLRVLAVKILENINKEKKARPEFKCWKSVTAQWVIKTMVV